jgi:hypothetical protein
LQEVLRELVVVIANRDRDAKLDCASACGLVRLQPALACQPKLESEGRARLRAFGATAGNLRVDSERRLVDGTRLELVTSALRTLRSPS